MVDAVDFSRILKQLRSESGLGIKRLAPELGVNYTYLSKLEKGGIRPSEEVVERIAHYFNYDRDTLLLAAGWVPADVLKILRQNPDDALGFLRERFGRKRANQPA